MKYIVSRNGNTLISSENPYSIPSDNLTSMSNLGFEFYIEGDDGVKIKCNALKFKDILENEPDSTSISPTRLKEEDLRINHSNVPDKTPSHGDNKANFQRNRSSKQVKCIQTGKIYKSMSAAGRDMGIDPAAISYAIQNNKKTSGGYTFELVEECDLENDKCDTK